MGREEKKKEDVPNFENRYCCYMHSAIQGFDIFSIMIAQNGRSKILFAPGEIWLIFAEIVHLLRNFFLFYRQGCYSTKYFFNLHQVCINCAEKSVFLVRNYTEI